MATDLTDCTSLTNTIHHYLDNRQSIDQSINDMQHKTDLYILKNLKLSVTNYEQFNFFT